MCIWNCPKEERHCSMCMYMGKCERNKVKDPRHLSDYVFLMNDLFGKDITTPGRSNQMAWARNIVAYQLLLEGFHPREIAKVLKRDRTTVIYAIQRAESALNSPKMYVKEMMLWKNFQEKLTLYQN